MRPTPNIRIERYRQVHPTLGASQPGENWGHFKVGRLYIISSDGLGWDHVSVSVEGQCPSWAEMCKVKDLFWAEEETVVQFHPKESEYINCHPYVLHLWSKQGEEYELPPSLMVGLKTEGQ